MYFLTTEQNRFFRDTGYIRLTEKIPENYLEKLRNVILRDMENKVQPYRVNEKGQVRRLDRLVDRDPIFLEVLRLPIISHPLQSLLGPNVELTRFRHNHATLNSKDDIPFKLHRDILQWSRSVVTALIYLEEATVENGCTHIVPTTQYLPFAGMPPDGGGGNWAVDHELYHHVLSQALPIPMPRGGILLLDSLAFHSVGINSTGQTRMSMTVAFHSVDELSGLEDDPKRTLLVGQRIYKGSDKQKVSGLLQKPDEQM